MLLGVGRTGAVLLMVSGVWGDRWARHLHALGDFVCPVRYASLSGHVPLISLGRVVVFGHAGRDGWRDEERSWGEEKKIVRAGIYTVGGGTAYMRSAGEWRARKQGRGESGWSLPLGGRAGWDDGKESKSVG